MIPPLQKSEGKDVFLYKVDTDQGEVILPRNQFYRVSQGNKYSFNLLTNPAGNKEVYPPSSHFWLVFVGAIFISLGFVMFQFAGIPEAEFTAPNGGVLTYNEFLRMPLNISLFLCSLALGIGVLYYLLPIIRNFLSSWETINAQVVTGDFIRDTTHDSTNRSNRNNYGSFLVYKYEFNGDTFFNSKFVIDDDLRNAKAITIRVLKSNPIRSDLGFKEGLKSLYISLLLGFFFLMFAGLFYLTLTPLPILPLA